MIKITKTFYIPRETIAAAAAEMSKYGRESYTMIAIDIADSRVSDDEAAKIIDVTVEESANEFIVDFEFGEKSPASVAIIDAPQF